MQTHSNVFDLLIDNISQEAAPDKSGTFAKSFQFLLR